MLVGAWPEPTEDGTLSADERALDKKARAVISAELGHSREQITVTYLGR